MAQIRWLVMITLLVASRGWAKDLSAGFDPRQVPREAIEKLAPISVGGFDPQQMFSGLTPVAVPGDWAQALKPVEVPPDLKQALVPVHAYEAGLAIWWTKLVRCTPTKPDWPYGGQSWSKAHKSTLMNSASGQLNITLTGLPW